jgi:hypothetical protein
VFDGEVVFVGATVFVGTFVLVAALVGAAVVTTSAIRVGGTAVSEGEVVSVAVSVAAGRSVGRLVVVFSGVDEESSVCVGARVGTIAPCGVLVGAITMISGWRAHPATTPHDNNANTTTRRRTTILPFPSEDID